MYQVVNDVMLTLRVDSVTIRYHIHSLTVLLIRYNIVAPPCNETVTVSQ